MSIKDAILADPDIDESVKAAFLKLCKECERLQRAARDAVYPEEGESPAYLANGVNDGAHAILDTAHDLLYALKAQKLVDNASE